MHSETCKSHCNGGVKVALGGRFAALAVPAARGRGVASGSPR